MLSHRSLVRLAVPLLALAFAAPARAAEIDKYLPDDSEVVVNVNVRGLLSSPVVKDSALPQLKALLESSEEARGVLRDLDFDPFQDLDTITAAGPGGNDQDKGLIIVHGKFDLDRFRKLGDQSAKDYPDVLKIHKVNDGKGGKFDLYEVNVPEQNTPLFVALPNNKTLLASFGKDYVVDALKKEFSTEKPVLRNKDFQTLLQGQDPRQHIYVAAVGAAIARNDTLPEQVRAPFRNLDAVGGGLTFGDDIKIEVVGLAKTARDARDLSRTVNDGVTQGIALLGLLAMNSPEFQPVVDILKSVRCSAKDKAVVIKAEISAEVIGELKKLGK
jgi:hypothetical protein